MKQFSSCLLALLQVRAMVFGLAVSNFALLWTLDQRRGGIGALVDPWYHPWSYFNEPSRLLVAAPLLAMGRAWSDLAAVSLSAYMVIRFIYLFAIWNGSWQWSFLSKYDPHFVSSYESQYLLALVIFCAGLLSDGGTLASISSTLVRDLFRSSLV